MKNLLLRRGVMVKARTSDYGLTKGQVYTVEASSDGLGLKVQTDLGDVILVDALGSCLDACDDVALHRCPVVTLPRGREGHYVLGNADFDRLVDEVGTDLEPFEGIGDDGQETIE